MTTDTTPRQTWPTLPAPRPAEFPLLYEGACVGTHPGVDLAPHAMSWTGTIDGRAVTLHWADYAVAASRWSLHVQVDDDRPMWQAATAVEAIARMRAEIGGAS